MLRKVSRVIEMPHHGRIRLLAGLAGLRITFPPLCVDHIANLAQSLGACRRNQLRHKHIAEFKPLQVEVLSIRGSHAEGL
jgi:hypothetical protein